MKRDTRIIITSITGAVVVLVILGALALDLAEQRFNSLRTEVAALRSTETNAASCDWVAAKIRDVQGPAKKKGAKQ